AFLYMTGAWPAQQVDHKDMDHTNNAWRNLRDASASENAINKNIRRRKSRLPRGVHRLPSGRFQACLSVNSRLQYLGAFDTIKEASDAYLAAAKKRSEEFLPKEYLKQPLRPFVDNEQR
ncbi:MAG: HNH endonuclease, partial [Oricola sp.]|nr:HNH endonuclease [Oricola sp.]